MEANFEAREFDPAKDFPMVDAWHKLHGGRGLNVALLPPVGVVVHMNGEPVACVFMHLSVGVGVAFLEDPVSRPILTVAESKAAFAHALPLLEKIALENDYGIFLVNTPPAIGRFLETQGFTIADNRPKITMFKSLRKETD